MTGAVITPGVSLVNPDRLSKEQLKAELHRIQEQSLSMGSALHDMNVVAHRQAEVILRLVDAHEAGDKAGIERELQRLSDWRSEQAKGRAKPN
jgi:hypothetical protein